MFRLSRQSFPALVPDPDAIALTGRTGPVSRDRCFDMRSEAGPGSAFGSTRPVLPVARAENPRRRGERARLGS